MFNPEYDGEQAFPVDGLEAIRTALAYADRGLWTVRVRLPNNRRLTVRAIIRMYRLERLVRGDLNVAEF